VLIFLLDFMLHTLKVSSASLQHFKVVDIDGAAHGIFSYADKRNKRKYDLRHVAQWYTADWGDFQLPKFLINQGLKQTV